MTDEDRESPLPAPLVVRCGGGDLEDLLSREWLIANRIGAYASSTVVGCNTRRYHGLLVGATAPPVGRVLSLSTIMEQLIVGETTYDLSTFEFAGAFSPCGWVHLEEFRNDSAATFVFRAGDVQLIKEVLPAEDANAVAIRYTLLGGQASLRLRPFVALRDFHDVRDARDHHRMTFECSGDTIEVQDRAQAFPALHLQAPQATFSPGGNWWCRFRYRTDIARGQDGFEDLYTPGEFLWRLGDGKSRQLTASLAEPVTVAFEPTRLRRHRRQEELAESVGPEADELTRRLAVATDAFVVNRSFAGSAGTRTILAGYHWFADWGRDAFIALPGLLLETRRFDEAGKVFRTFADRISDGMIPNRFDDYTDKAHYNSIDASLWFIIAADRYLAASGAECVASDVDHPHGRFWRDTLLPACRAILRAYHDGTRFDIRADADGLLAGGSPETQLTWMDVALGDEVVTPRHGKAVEINALWYCAHRILADRCVGAGDGSVEHYAQEAERIASAFARAFWNAEAGCLYDCITAGRPDESVRPNQIFAVSLPYSPLSTEQQTAVVRKVKDKLLTPMGLRTLSPRDGRYRRRYGGSLESRDRSYHQGTVWAWLIGPFVEAYLRVHEAKPFAVAQARQWLDAFGPHLAEAGVGFISEIFDGDPPHRPRGCIGQAWSVAEVLRAKRLVANAERETASGSGARDRR